MGEKTQGGINMPDKESFTFSDKLRKSKSVPLSKRLPSIVGGQNKQKRTLVQRAQRDLPFILVAALALLLLPFLSRTGSDDIAGTGDIAWNALGGDNASFVEGGGADIMPAGTMKDPLDWIISPRSEVETSGVTAGTDATKSAYGSGSKSGYGSRYGDDDSGSSYGSRSRSYSSSGSSSTKRPDYATRQSYDEQYKKKVTNTPATTKYGKKTQAGVRKSFERKGTDINRALRISQMPGQKGGAGISHALPIGQGPNRTPSTSFREGVRPVALQPMESKGGIGRSMTGENLYAEATRSIGEMNRGGPAKANLLAAQMRDVDGSLTPQGPGFGGPGAGAASGRSGKAGGPNNTNGYHIDKPWWWDMMQSRSQKMWELLYYKPREIWYTNMYNYASQLMNCLFTGNSKGDVSTMFGQSAGDSDWACVKDGKEVMPRYNKQKTTKTTDKEGNTTEETVDGAWEKRCVEIMKGEVVEKEKNAKSFLDVRLECVGLDVVVDWLKSLAKHTKYDSNCEGVNDTPMRFSLDVTRANSRNRRNKRRENRLKGKTVIALLATHNISKKEMVVYLERGNELSSEGSIFAGEFNKKYPNCTLSRLVAFVSKKSASKVQSKIDAYQDEDLTDADRGQVTAGLQTCLGEGVDNGEVVPNDTVMTNPMTIDDIRNRAELGRGKKIGEDGARYAECEVWGKKPVIWNKYIHGSKCSDYPEIGVQIKESVEFKATIDNSADKHVFAVLVDEIQGESKARVAYIVDFGLESNKGLFTCDAKGSCNYVFRVNVASFGWNFENFGTNVKGMQGNVTNTLTGEQSLQTTQEANKLQSNDIAAANAQRERMCNQCKQDRGPAPDPSLDNENSHPYAEWLHACDNECNGPSIGSYGTAQNSSSQEKETARGAGMIFWIVTTKDAKLKVKIHDDLNKDLGEVSVSDLIESHQGILSSVCRYRWCNGLADCLVPRGDGSVCKKEDGTYWNYTVIRLDDEELLLPIPPALGESYNPNGQEALCSELCRDEEGVVCPHRKVKLSEVEDILPPGYIDLIPLCTPYCQYKGKAYLTATIDGEYYISDATVQAVATDGLPECKPLAWSFENDVFSIYRMEKYDDETLPLIPNKLVPPIECTEATNNNDEKINLTFLEQSSLFITIRNQAISSGTPTMFKLFPKLELPGQVDFGPLLEACVFCGPSMYENVHIEASEATVDKISTQVSNCLAAIKELKAKGIVKEGELENIFFYGYASKRGSHKPGYITSAPNVGCDTNGASRGDTDKDDVKWGYCNKALSEDRILYIMDELVGRLNGTGEGKYDIGVRKDKTYPKSEYNGFRHTQLKSLVDSNNRFDKINYLNDANGTEFTFVSRPCGSDAAKKDYKDTKANQAGDRYVVVTPMDTANYCTPSGRMECDAAISSMKKFIEETLKGRSQGQTVPTVEVAEVPVEFGTGDDDDPARELTEEEEKVLALVTNINRTSELERRNPVICNRFIKEANGYLELDQSDGVTAKGDVAALLQKRDALLAKFPAVAQTFQNNVSLESGFMFNGAGPMAIDETNATPVYDSEGELLFNKIDNNTFTYNGRVLTRQQVEDALGSSKLSEEEIKEILGE